MPLTPTYNLLATAVPALQHPTTYRDPGAGPVVSLPLTTDPAVMIPRFNALADRIDLLAATGGGAYGIYEGPSLADTNANALTIDYGPIKSLIGGSVVSAAGSLVMTDAGGGQNYLWQSQAGAVSSVANSMTPGSTPSIYSGRVTAASGDITGIDLSGVVFIRGGLAWRRTADPGAPGDTPPATMRFVAETLGGLYLWDGTRYVPLWEPLAAQKDTIAASESVTLAAGYQVQVARRLTVRGRVKVRGLLRVR